MNAKHALSQSLSSVLAAMPPSCSVKYENVAEALLINLEARGFHLVASAHFDNLSGPRIRATRKANGISVAQLSEKSGLTEATIYSFETGRRRFNLKTLEILNRALEAISNAAMNDD